ncbi:MAG TPA: type I-B CRISPR-associated protein Cas8b1/Cst1 [Candidatus Deferrimicrobium sp.]|nr:type I-B CRISPR-associated protein Cas8b1/Cst1 [Candidatus Kapabacteria bacterium]HLP62047.1 type I-B CRISPR-associated protein Cas8b1/Cst1 [Candidatus Deferrimicrobium sp.]
MMSELNDGSKRVRIEIKDWLFNAGILGLYRILKNAEQDVLIKGNYIECDASCFEGFEKSFFDYFSSVYGQDGLWYRLTTFCKNNFALDDFAETNVEKIKEFIKVFDKELVSDSYCTAYEIITGDKDFIKNKLKVVKDKAAADLQKLEKIKEIYSFFVENKDIIQAKYTSYSVINNYWEGVSFLNTQQVNLNMFDIFRRDFVEPVFNYLKAEEKKKTFGSCLICNRVLNKKSDGAEGLSWLKMDLDSARKTSVYWNHQPDIIVCPVCNLVYSCVPAGFVTYKKNGLFINDNSGMARLIAINNVVLERMDGIERMESLENLTYTYIINMIRQIREENIKWEIDNIQVVKMVLKSKNDKRYVFSLLSKQVIAVIKKSKKELDALVKLYDVFLDRKNRINLYAEVIERIYRNMDLYPLVGLLLGLAIRKKKKNGFADLVFKINMNFIGGQMSEKKIQVMKLMGLKLKKGYKNEQNKIPGIAYRLLNNLKTKNINAFMDVAINCHMHIGQEVPTLLVECIDNVERFQAYGYAFLLGFMGEEYNPEAKKENLKED